MPAFRIDSAVVAQKAAQIQAMLPELHQLITQHQNHIDTLMTVWKGQSATGTHTVNGQVVQGNNKIHQDFHAFGQNLAVNVTNYVNADVASTPR